MILGRVEREATLTVKALTSDIERRDAERELRMVRMEQALTERLRTLQDGRDGTGDIPAVPQETAEQIEKALTLLAQPVVTFTEVPQVVVNLPSERSRRKTITMRRDEQGNAVADVIEREG